MKQLIKTLWDWSHTDVGDSILGGILYIACIIVMWLVAEAIACCLY